MFLNSGMFFLVFVLPTTNKHNKHQYSLSYRKKKKKILAFVGPGFKNNFTGLGLDTNMVPELIHISVLDRI